MICSSARKIVFHRGLSDPSCGFGGWCYECGIFSWVGWEGLVGWIWMSTVYSGYLPLGILRWKQFIGRWEGKSSLSTHTSSSSTLSIVPSMHTESIFASPLHPSSWHFQRLSISPYAVGIGKGSSVNSV